MTRGGAERESEGMMVVQHLKIKLMIVVESG
jgi:hypothetical protein